MSASVPSVTVVHETGTRLRLRFAHGDQVAAARVAVELLTGVKSARASRASRSLAVSFDGRRRTRQSILKVVESLPAAPRAVKLPRRQDESLPIEVPLLAAALTPLLPPNARPVAALALVGVKSWNAWRRGEDITAAALDSVALVSTALTGHALTATTSLLMGAVAERRRNALLRESDRLLAGLAMAPDDSARVLRSGKPTRLALDAIEVGDRVRIDAGQAVPVDGIVVDGQGEVIALAQDDAGTLTAAYGARLAAGTRVLEGTLTLRAERRAAQSRVARLRDHVRHLLQTRDAPGALTPDLERLVAVPVTAAGLVLALTGDAARTAAMLQADPQLGIALAQPVAREAAVYATARSGLLLGGLEALDRLASATTMAFEDVGVIGQPYWHVVRIDCHRPGVDEGQMLAWLTRLAGHADAALASAGFPDEQVARWREHGALLRQGGRLLHVAGARQIAHTWDITMSEPDRRSLVRRLGVVENGVLLATVHMGCRLHDGVAERFAQLRALGVKRIAIFTEDPTSQPAAALSELGADAVISRDRALQERWLAEATERGERVALVHTGLRDLLPPGGLSLCPVDADAGAHGVLLGEPLASLVAARATARSIRRQLRLQTAGAVTLNAALMVGAAMRWLPPIATAMLKHGASLLLLRQGSRLARVRREAPRVSSHSREAETV
jgi:Cu2+-exporting ATPase